jgi:hypothetical protein
VPKTELSFVKYFADLPDPRVDRTKWHRLDDHPRHHPLRGDLRDR